MPSNTVANKHDFYLTISIGQFTNEPLDKIFIVVMGILFFNIIITLFLRRFEISLFLLACMLPRTAKKCKIVSMPLVEKRDELWHNFNFLLKKNSIKLKVHPWKEIFGRRYAVYNGLHSALHSLLSHSCPLPHTHPQLKTRLFPPT